MTPLTSREVGRVRQFVRHHVARSASVRGWMALMAPHWPEVLQRLSASDPLRTASQRALRQAARLVVAHAAGWRPIVDEAAIVAARRMLDRLDAVASEPLRAALAELRRDVESAGGRPLDEALGLEAQE